jgi:NodT family efflux transporter outer membrane factor (OMF) lipoprotein
MNKYKTSFLWIISIVLVSSCKLPALIQKTEKKDVAANYNGASFDTTNSGKLKWQDYFTDPELVTLIDSALNKNQELNIFLQELNISTNEIQTRKGAYLPFLGIFGGAGTAKSGRYTNGGAAEEANQIVPGKKNPAFVSDLVLSANVAWEVDIWKKLRNSRQSAIYQYLSTIEGKNFMVTNLISEISNSYYELIALDNQLEILQQNIEIQQNALEIVKLEKQAAKVTELAVRKFEAEVLKNQSRQYYIKQQITITENEINFLVGRFPQNVQRNSTAFLNSKIDTAYVGIPSQLLENRPDIRQAEQSLLAAKLDVTVAKANFYPSLMINANFGTQAFQPQYLANLPASLISSLIGGAFAPIVNRNAIKSNYLNSNSKQIQAIFNYERAILNGYIEVANQLSNIENLKKSYDLKVKQVDALTESINISTGLFRSARADYMEVLLTQRDALESKFELIETKKLQMHAKVNIYRALGGGWR